MRGPWPNWVADILRVGLAAAVAPPQSIGLASALANLGPEYATEALQVLRAVAADATVGSTDRYLATRRIRDLTSSG